MNDIIELRKFRFHLVDTHSFENLSRYVSQPVFIIDDYVTDNPLFGRGMPSRVLLVDISDSDITYLTLTGEYKGEIQVSQMSDSVQQLLAVQLLTVTERKKSLERQYYDHRERIIKRCELEFQQKLKKLQSTCEHTYIVDTTGIIPWVTRVVCPQCGAHEIQIDDVLRAAHVDEYK